MTALMENSAKCSTVSENCAVASTSNTQHCLPLNREVAGTVLHFKPRTLPELFSQFPAQELQVPTAKLLF